MRFDPAIIRRTRKTIQWMVVPVLLAAVFYLSHPILPLLLCFVALGMLLLAAWAGMVEEQVAAHGKSWFLRKALALPREVVMDRGRDAPPADYRKQHVDPTPPRVIARRLHLRTRVVVLLPVALGGAGLGWRLFKRWTVREFNEWDQTPSDPGDRFVQSILDELRRREALERVRSTHVNCSGPNCSHCKQIASEMEGV